MMSAAVSVPASDMTRFSASERAIFSRLAS